jgi:hypothetical protein
MKHHRHPLLVSSLAGLLAVSAMSCSGDKIGHTPNPPRLVVVLDPMDKVGSIDAPLDLKVNIPISFHATVHAVAANGAIDTTFNRYVRISTKPGAIDPLTGADTDGRNVLLKAGESVAVEVKISNAYGPTYVVADDLGYVPKDPLSDPPPKCSNGIDDDGDGTVDFPADPGCAFANDDSEEGGTYAEGVSTPIYFKLPRIADIRGLRCDPTLGCSGNGLTPYPREALQVDTGLRADGSFAFDTVVTRISASGFYVSDLGDTRGDPPGTAGFNSVFAFNFSAPPQMRTCDRIKTYGGTASEFFGFTQMNYPTWTLEEWDPARRPCLVPEPERLTPTLIQSPTELLKRSASLVRVETAPDGSQMAMITPKFGPGDVPKTPGGLYAPSAEIRNPDGTIKQAAASNCDFDKNGKITFAAGNPENDCNTACTADPQCTEWSNYVARSTFRITVTDSNGQSAAIQADATSAAQFDPVALKGVPLRHFAGTMSFFSGGAQYTIEVRCKDDITIDVKAATFPSDRVCKVDADCSTKAGFPQDFTCVQLNDGLKACRKVDPTNPNIKEPPPLACVFPRTFLDSNPQ